MWTTELSRLFDACHLIFVNDVLDSLQVGLWVLVVGEATRSKTLRTSEAGGWESDSIKSGGERTILIFNAV